MYLPLSIAVWVYDPVSKLVFGQAIKWFQNLVDYCLQTVVPQIKYLAFIVFAKIPGSIFLSELLHDRTKRNRKKIVERKIEKIEIGVAAESKKIETVFSNKAESKNKEVVSEQQADVLIYYQAVQQLDELVRPYLKSSSAGPIVRFDCPHCQSKIRLRKEYLGKKIECPNCQATTRVSE